tara:strand:+ start:994 stop:1674 length:681 start_codon:yes stop_codon:yes gene_type:complete
MKILCSICGRKGSKGVKNKNLTLVNHKPLIYYTIQQAKKSKLFDQIVVSTNDKKIQAKALEYGASCWFLRSNRLSNSSSPKIPVIRDNLIKSEKYFNSKFEYIIDLDISAPLRDHFDIRRAYNKFIKFKYDNLFSVNKSKKNPYFNMVEMRGEKVYLSKNKKKFYSRQQLPIVYSLNASIYVWKRKALLQHNNLIGKKTGIYEMSEEKSIDIDSKFDLKLVKFLMK